jgi:polysaccharide export outer membrane protein
VRCRGFGAAAVAAFLIGAPAGIAQTRGDASGYAVGPRDVLRISVWNQEDVSGEYAVDNEGTFTFPLIGRVETRGLTVRELEADLRRRLADGFFKDPQVTVSVTQFRSQRVFVVGQLRQPGTYALEGDMSLIEALARAGSTTPDSADHAFIMRSAGNEKRGPVLPGEDASAEMIKVNLKALERGESERFALRDGDTVFVPRASNVFVFGHVRNPGSYPIGQGTTVLQALSLAGGVSEYGAVNRIKIVRLVGGAEREIKVKLNALVQPGDTIVVPARYF